MEELRHISADELDEIFREATGKAALEALAAGLSVVGMDENGRLVEMHPDGSRTLLSK